MYKSGFCSWVIRYWHFEIVVVQNVLCLMFLWITENVSLLFQNSLKRRGRTPSPWPELSWAQCSLSSSSLSSLSWCWQLARPRHQPSQTKCKSDKYFLLQNMYAFLINGLIPLRELSHSLFRYCCCSIEHPGGGRLQDKVEGWQIIAILAESHVLLLFILLP